MLRVVFQVLKSGVVVEKTFDSYELCRKFVNKCKYSKRVSLISYPIFYD